MATLVQRVRGFFVFWIEFTLIFTVIALLGFAVFRWKNQLDRSPAQIRSLADTQLRTSDGTAYWTYGSQGPNLVLIHGLLGSKHTFERVKTALGSRFRLWAYDTKGMGFTPARGDLSLEGQVEQLHHFIEELNLGDVILLGHSTGGGIAQAFAARYPKSVKHLILVDSVDYLDTALAGNWESTNLRDIVYAGLRSPYLAQLGPHFSGQWITRKILSHQYFDPNSLTNGAVLAHAYPMQLPGYWERIGELVEAPSQKWLSTLRASFVEATFPVTTLWGINDAWFFPRQGQQLCQRFKKCTFLMIEEAGHLPHEEQPDRFVERILALFL